MKIAIVAGGFSSEYTISIKSGQMLLNEISKIGHPTYLVEISPEGWFVHGENTRIPIRKDDFSFYWEGYKVSFDVAIIAIHGTPGEDGKLQGYFDLLNIPYTCSGVLPSAITFDKYTCKIFVNQLGIKTAPAILVNNNESLDYNTVLNQIGLPCIVKPNASGSSFGVTKVNKIEELETAVKNALSESEKIVIEKFIKGTEVTCGMVALSNDEDFIFPITEIVSKNEFFDFEAKYTDGMSDEITPARIDLSLEIEVKKQTALIYHALQCKGITRTDFIIADDGIYFLEVNTVPGMSPNSIVPKQLKALNISIAEIYDKIISKIYTNR